VKKRLAKIAREHNVSLAELAEFLRINGYQCDEDPHELISIEAEEMIHFNFPAYLANRKNEKVGEKRKQRIDTGKVLSIDYSPVEIKIIEAATNEKKLIERLIGFTDYNWKFKIHKCNGECSQPINFSVFDEVICDLLLIKSMSELEIARILGLDIAMDIAEFTILHQAINSLKKDKMIDGDESSLWLNELGKEYAKNGVKYSTFKRNFEIFIDDLGLPVESSKNVLSVIKSQRNLSVLDATNSKLEIETVKTYAEFQAPDIHFPAKKYLLQGFEELSTESYIANVWVVLLENFRDNTIRAIVFDEKQNEIVRELSDTIDNHESIKNELLEKLIKIDENIEFTDEEKNEEQIQYEHELINKQEAIDIALTNSDEASIGKMKADAIASKRHFNTLEFEVELKSLFDTTSDTIIIQSPWVRDYAFKNRIPFILNYLKKGGKVFIAYSENEDSNGDAMVQEESMKKILDLEKNNFNFYYCEFPAFHYKNVWLIKPNGENTYYSGSYNILSFFVSQGLTKVRQEKMTKMKWDDELTEQYNEIIKGFGLKYVEKAIAEFDQISQNPPSTIDKDYLQRLKTLDNTKLKPFLNIGIIEFEKAFQTLENTKIENLRYYKKIFLKNEIALIKSNLNEIGARQISNDRKFNLKRELDRLSEEFQDVIDEFKPLFIELHEKVKHLIVFEFNKNEKQRQHQNKNKR
jgi:hypothetical protein